MSHKQWCQGNDHIYLCGGRPARSLMLLVRASGYVEQFDTLLAELTVREMLLYTAELKCPLSESLAKKRQRVDTLLETLALERCANTMIGDSLARGISGGQVWCPPLLAVITLKVDHVWWTSVLAPPAQSLAQQHCTLIGDSLACDISGGQRGAANLCRSRQNQDEGMVDLYAHQGEALHSRDPW